MPPITGWRKRVEKKINKGNVGHALLSAHNLTCRRYEEADSACCKTHMQWQTKIHSRNLGNVRRDGLYGINARRVFKRKRIRTRPFPTLDPAQPSPFPSERQALLLLHAVGSHGWVKEHRGRRLPCFPTRVPVFPPRSFPTSILPGTSRRER